LEECKKFRNVKDSGTEDLTIEAPTMFQVRASIVKNYVGSAAETVQTVEKGISGNVVFDWTQAVSRVIDDDVSSEHVNVSGVTVGGVVVPFALGVGKAHGKAQLLSERTFHVTERNEVATIEINEVSAVVLVLSNEFHDILQDLREAIPPC
jgi:hypothetical protein